VKRNLLNCLEKRDLLNQSAVSLEMLKQWGEQFEENGMFHDAVDFYQKAHAKEALGRIFKAAAEDGDAFLFNKVSRILKVEPTEEEWIRLAERAKELGKMAFAMEGYRRAGREVMDDGQVAERDQ